MTTLFFHVILENVENRTSGPERRNCASRMRDKSMLQKYLYSFKNIDCPCNLPGIFVPSADKAEWSDLSRLNRPGSSGGLQQGL